MHGDTDSPGGFTLIELLVAMLLVGLLAAIAWLRVAGVNEEAYRSALKADLHSVALAQELYFQTHMTYGALEQLEVYTPTEGVLVEITHASSDGFGATAVHAGLGGVTCGFFNGSVPAGAAGPADTPGRVVCD